MSDVISKCLRCRSFYEDNNSLKTKLKTLSMDGKQINSNWLVSY